MVSLGAFAAEEQSLGGARGLLPSLCHDAREHPGSPLLAAPHPGTSEPLETTHQTTQGRVTLDVFGYPLEL